MSQAYGKDTQEEAKQALQALQVTLPSHDRKAANRLAEGVEETLTLHKLSMVREFRRSLQTTSTPKTSTADLVREPAGSSAG